MPFQIFLKLFTYIKKIIQIYSKIKEEKIQQTEVFKNYMQREFKNIINK